ncbi:MAG TPA: hypothetical protein VL092_09415 [Chitinophagaceae bacterium]|nr:hypothetical protein [Chitinophagaceae bacterium]
MTRKMRLYLLAMLVLGSTGCRKVERDVSNYYPSASTDAVTVQADGSVLVSAQVLSEGSDPVKYAGFCMDTLPEPHMLSNQQTVDTIFGAHFHAVYKKLKPFTRYYFRSFVANANGYAYGNTVSLDNVQIDTNIFACRPAPDTLKLLRAGRTIVNRFKQVEKPRSRALQWVVSADAGDYSLTITFSDYPSQGIYTTSDADVFDDPYVKVELYGPATGFVAIPLELGTALYVRSPGPGHLEFSFCGAKFWDGISYTLDASLVVPVK